MTKGKVITSHTHDMLVVSYNHPDFIEIYLGSLGKSVAAKKKHLHRFMDLMTKVADEFDREIFLQQSQKEKHVQMSKVL